MIANAFAATPTTYQMSLYSSRAKTCGRPAHSGEDNVEEPSQQDNGE